MKSKISASCNLFKKGVNKNFFKPYKGFKKYDLIIFDNIYPHPISGFRYEEFTILLETFTKAKLLMNPTSYQTLKTPLNEHKKHVVDLIKKKPFIKGKLQMRNGFVNINAKLFYCVFIDNVYNNLPYLEKFKIPFIFTLYPGAGFQIKDEMCNLKLKKIFSSPMFKKVIVTQQFSKLYLMQNELCDEENIELIFGCVVPQDSLNLKLEQKRYFKINKQNFDICFCAAKYMPLGKDKGYDIFIEASRRLSKQFNFVKFHVIGGFNESDIDVTDFKNQIKFYGYQEFEKLSEIFKGMDVIISPNKPFLLSKGSFDGFPLGAVVEAVFNGVVALVSDDLNENTQFKENEEIIIVDNDLNSIEKAIVHLIENPKKLKEISIKGRKKFQQIYYNRNQMNPRVKILQNEIN